MDIIISPDNRKRMCAICSKQIVKGDIYCVHDEIVYESGYNNTYKWFAHINCLLHKLNEIKKTLNPYKIKIHRYKK